MGHVLIVGLPKGAQHLVDTFAKREGLLVDRIYAEPGHRGSLSLLPRPEHCLPAIQRYFDSYGSGATDYAGSRVIVLPYADVPHESRYELDVAVEMGAKVEYADPAGDPTWPKLLKRKRPDQTFHVALARKLESELLPLSQNRNQLPSEFIAKLVGNCPQLLIAQGALDACDLVAPHRFKFLRDAAQALVDAVAAGLSSRFDACCNERGLHHAQTGGSKFSVSVLLGEKTMQDIECCTHLKQGDRTTKDAAARMYYTFLNVDSVRYVALLYAGPHPDGNKTCRVQLPGLNIP